MGGNNQTISSLPRMIIREPAESGTIPKLPTMPPEYQYGGAWMDPQWKKNLNGYKKLFTVYPIQMAVILVVTIGLAIGLASLSSSACSGSNVETETSSSCGGSGGSENNNDNDMFGGGSIESDEADGLLGAPVSGNVGDVSVTILGYKFAEDVNGIDSIMVEYEVTNNGDASTFFYYLDHKAFQNGVQLTNSFGKTDEYDNQETILEIQPGGTHTVHCLYNLSTTTDPVEIRVSDVMQLVDDVVTTTFDLGGENVPAVVPDETEATTTTATTTTTTAPAIVSEGATGDFYIKFIDSSIVTDDWDDPYVCAAFDFTNNSADATSAWSALSYYATQDGNDLSEGTFYFNEAYTTLQADVQPGETVRISLMFSGYDANGGNALVSVCDYWDDENVISFSCPVK